MLCIQSKWPSLCIVLEYLIVTLEQNGTMHQYLPAATKLWPRLCFYLCLWFCSQGEGLPQCMLGYPPGSRPPGKQTSPGSRPSRKQTPPPESRHPTWEADTLPGSRPPRESDPPGNQTPPGKQTPLGKQTPWHTVNEWPVHILLECIIV